MQELRGQLESERRRANEAVHDNSELRQLLLRASATLGEPARSKVGAAVLRDGTPGRTSGHGTVMSTPIRTQFPVVDNVRRKLAAMADNDKVASQIELNFAVVNPTLMHDYISFPAHY